MIISIILVVLLAAFFLFRKQIDNALTEKYDENAVPTGSMFFIAPLVIGLVLGAFISFSSVFSGGWNGWLKIVAVVVGALAFAGYVMWVYKKDTENESAICKAAVSAAVGFCAYIAGVLVAGQLIVLAILAALCLLLYKQIFKKAKSEEDGDDTVDTDDTDDDDDNDSKED